MRGFAAAFVALSLLLVCSYPVLASAPRRIQVEEAKLKADPPIRQARGADLLAELARRLSYRTISRSVPRFTERAKYKQLH